MNKLFFLALILLCSCGSIHTVESSLETRKANNQYPYFDEGIKVKYQVTNDAQNIHLKLMTSDYKTIVKILSTGLKVCFDVNGKKSEKVYVEYPLVKPQVFSDQILARSARTQGIRFNLKTMISEIPNEVVFSSNGVENRIPVLSTDSDIKVTITPIRNNTIVYDLLIPISRISKEGLPALSKLSIGVVLQKANVSSIANKFEDISGEDAFGDLPPGNLYGRVYHQDKTFAVPTIATNNGSTATTVRSTGVYRSGRIKPVNKYNRSNSNSSKYKSHEFWFKIHLLKN